MGVTSERLAQFPDVWRGAQERLLAGLAAKVFPQGWVGRHAGPASGG